MQIRISRNEFGERVEDHILHPGPWPHRIRLEEEIAFHPVLRHRPDATIRRDMMDVRKTLQLPKNVKERRSPLTIDDIKTIRESYDQVAEDAFKAIETSKITQNNTKSRKITIQESPKTIHTPTALLEK